MKKIAFIGANNPETRRMMIAVRRVCEVEFIGYIDNDPAKLGTTHCGLPIFGGYDAVSSLDPREVNFVNLITRDTLTRFNTSAEVTKRGFDLANFIHPSIDLTDVKLGIGNYLQESVILQAGVTIGHNSSIHMGTLIGHETKIGSSSFIAHGVSVSGLVSIGDGVFVGTGAVILPRVSIGDWAVIGAGAVVFTDVPIGATVLGNPGRVIKKVSPTISSGVPWHA
jgi:sugar O-acyltransferase (sialic acid O-acetyltransferase NeuD family)